MRKNLKVGERLYVALDFDFPKNGTKERSDFIRLGPREWLEQQTLGATETFRNLGVGIKIESIFDLCGPNLLSRLKNRVPVFADLKKSGTPETLRRTGSYLNHYPMDMVTVMCSTGVDEMIAFKSTLPTCKVIGVTCLTTHTEEDVSEINRRMYVYEMVDIFAGMARKSGLDGVVCAGGDVERVRMVVGNDMYIIATNIRSCGIVVENDDQNPKRTTTPEKAIKDGADMVVMGRQIMKSSDRVGATMRVIDEIANAMAAV